MTPPQHRDRPLFKITMDPGIHKMASERADELGLPFSRYIEQLVRRDLMRARIPGRTSREAYIDALIESDDFFDRTPPGQLDLSGVQPRLDQIVKQQAAETQADIEKQRSQRSATTAKPKKRGFGPQGAR